MSADDRWPVLRASVSRLATLLLAIGLLVAVAGVVSVALTPDGQEQPTTEFYLLGPDGEAGGYPANLSVGESGEFVVGITNNEQQPERYTVVVVIDGTVADERSVDLEHGETREAPVSVGAQQSGELRVRVLLFRGAPTDSLDSPYRELRLVIPVD